MNESPLPIQLWFANSGYNGTLSSIGALRSNVVVCLIGVCIFQFGCQQNQTVGPNASDDSQVDEQQPHFTQQGAVNRTLEYTTGWLAPWVNISEDYSSIVRIDLSLEDVEVGPNAGVLTIYHGSPRYDMFGDADASSLTKSRLRITTNELDPAELSTSIGGIRLRSGASADDRVIFGCDFLGAEPNRLQIVLSKRPFRHRLLLAAPEGSGHPKRILPLRLSRDLIEANRHPRIDEKSMQLRSSYFLTADKRFNQISLFTGDSGSKLTHDRNHPSFNAFGDVVRSTLLGNVTQDVALDELSKTDPSGEERRLFAASWKSLSPLEATLVLHPRVAGDHKLLLKDSGQIIYIIPLHSAKLRSWLSLKSQLSKSSQIEREVFDRVSEIIPYYFSFQLDGEQVVSAELYSLSDENQRVLEQLARLPHLRSLELFGYDLTGEHLAELKQIESLRFSHSFAREATLLQVGKLDRLKSLSFYTTHIDCQSLQHLSALTKLQHFSFHVGDPGSYADNFDEECLKVFSNFEILQTLSLNGIPLTEKAFDYLPATENLRSVELGYDVPFGGALEYAARIPQAEFRIGSGGLINLTEGLIAAPHTVTDVDLKPIARIDGVRTLRIPRAENISDIGLAHLSGARLRELELSHAPEITDFGVEHICRISTLQDLCLSDCEQVTGASIDHLKKLTHLKKISVFQTGINPRILQSAIPNCEVSH